MADQITCPSDIWVYASNLRIGNTFTLSKPTYTDFQFTTMTAIVYIVVDLRPDRVYFQMASGIRADMWGSQTVWKVNWAYFADQERTHATASTL